MHRRVGNGITGAIAALALAAGGMISPAHAEDTTDQGAVKLEKVEVTGSRIKRLDVEGPTPVTVISRDQIEKSGYTSVRGLQRGADGIWHARALDSRNAPVTVALDNQGKVTQAQ